MQRRTTAMIAVVAVIIHCVVGCCVRCINACDCLHGDDCAVACCDHHNHALNAPPCDQPVRTSIAASCPTKTEGHSERECVKCGKHKCAFILGDSFRDGFRDALALSAFAPTSCIFLIPNTEKQVRGQSKFEGAVSLFPKAELRLHLALAILII